MVNNNEVRIKKRDSLSKKIILNFLQKIQQGALHVYDADKDYLFGDINEAKEQSAILNIINPIAYKKIVLDGFLGAGTSYIDGDWDTDDLQKLIGVFIKNEEVFDTIEHPLERFLNWMRTISHKFNKNTELRAKDNILAHYDLGNDFFQLILDPLMMYSSGLYEPMDLTLNEASEKKLQQICTKLELKPGDHVLEIGTGWGGFAVYAAQKYGCKVTTTTISDKQYAFVSEQIKRLGLDSQIELLNLDYRKLTGQYDKLVSIEMIEAVGHKYFDTFFHQCNQLLKPNGLFFLQAIVINDQKYEAAKDEIDFIKKYIFPGGCLPSVFSISKSIATQTKMQLLSFEDIGKHYVTTLNHWHQNLLANKQAILDLGFTESFFRTWEFYFCYSAAGFETHYISDIHALWRKRA